MRSNDDAHVVVIGSGPAGAAAAHALARRGVRTTVLDAGAHMPRGLLIRAAGNTVVRQGTLNECRQGGHTSSRDATQWWWSRTLGGLSNFWTGAVPRFHQRDFDEGARLDDRFRWPITYDDLEPYYEIVEHMIGVTGSLDEARNLPTAALARETRMAADWRAIARRFDEQGRSLLPIPLAKGSPWMVARRRTEFNSYACVIRPLADAGLLTVVPGALVRSLQWSASSGRVETARYFDTNSGRDSTIAADAFVVAAGTLNTTRILSSSRSDDFPDGIGNTYGLLGRYLHDHPRHWESIDLGSSLRLPGHPLYLTRRDYETSEPLLAASATIGLASSRHRPLTYVRGSGRRIGVQWFGTVIPDHESRVSVGRELSDNHLDGPSIDIAYAYTARECENIDRARTELVELLAGSGVRARLTVEKPELTAGSSVHYGGTARMHNLPEHGVVDAWNRIHDAPNVIVCDMSCFTTGPEKNPTPTAMALAARAGDRLASDIGQR